VTAEFLEFMRAVARAKLMQLKADKGRDFNRIHDFPRWTWKRFHHQRSACTTPFECA
jgi:hypothetical protein